MTYYRRQIDNVLLQWKNSSKHKPLLLRGARQVGKSSSIRHLGEQFEFYVEINLERQKQIQSVFKGDLDIKKIVAEISAITQIPVIEGRTLLFFDEIQGCQEAISALRFFWEDLPGLHVIAAGSLLEFALNEIASFGVGRISSVFMYPMSFDEFLLAQGYDSLCEAKRQANVAEPLSEVLHTRLVELFRTFIMVGGMPEAVVTWIDTKEYLQCQNIHNEIVTTYEDDFGKYRHKASPMLIRATLRSVAHQIGSKFVYSRVGQDYRSAVVKEALHWLVLAGLVTPVFSTAGNGLPLGAEANTGVAKYLYIDSGLLLSILNMGLGNIGGLTENILLSSAADLVNKGSITEMIAGLEIMKCLPPTHRPELFYWQREAKGSAAEIDYLIAKDMQILPVEVKAGTQGGMKSLHYYMEQKHIPTAIRTSLENFGRIERGTSVIDICPLYALSSLFPGSK
ncbi:MAG: ATP-binding protein [Prevotella sp.]|nr:ATP-binding protein [Prevotella sp.]